MKPTKVSDASTRMIKERERIVEMERLLLHWIHDRQMQVESIDGSTICEKAKSIFDDLKCESAQSSGSVFEDFRASKGWFERFKHGNEIHSVVRHGQTLHS
jgi:hypothetical protein